MKQASVRFLKWTPLYESEKPFQIFGNLLQESADQRKSNLTWEEKQIQVQDVRDDIRNFGLDSHGFTICRLPGFAELSDTETITGEYIPAMKKMLQKELDDVGTVFVFDWRIRESRSEIKAERMINFSDQFQPLLPSNYAHIDTSPISVIRRIQDSFPNNAAQILRQRVRAVKYVFPQLSFLRQDLNTPGPKNKDERHPWLRSYAEYYHSVWKPLSNPVDEWGLAVCDGATVSSDDLIETDSIRRGSVSTHYYVKYNPDQTWYFLDRQAPDEALIFKHFDSKPGVEAPYTVHSSIKQLWPVENPKPRRSIEVRALIFSAEVYADEVA